MTSSRRTSGNINIIHVPKPMSMFSPSGLLRYFKAIMLGGVPMGVPIPPRLAATGILNVSAMRPLPLAGRAANTGVRKVSIMAAVAVLLTNMENTPVMSKKPNSTFSLLRPKGLIMERASRTSSPDLEAAMARMKPPKKSMITGSAKEAMTSFDLSNSPTPSPLKGRSALLVTVRHIEVMIPSEVAQEGIHSVSQESVANTKMAMMRCCTTVSPLIPKKSIGRFQTMVVTRMMPTNSQSFLGENAALRPGVFSSAIVLRFLELVCEILDGPKVKTIP